MTTTKHIFLLFFGLLWSLSSASHAQIGDWKNELLPLNVYNIKNGLTHNDVTAILKESKGYLWIATYDGVNIFDGYEFRHIRSTLDDKPLISNRVRSLCEDYTGNILIGTDNGLTVYDDTKQRFRTVYSNSFLRKDREGPIITRIFASEDKHEIFCLTENEGILIFDNDYNFKRAIGSTQNVQSGSVFNDMLSLGGDHFLCATSSGLYYYHYKNNTLNKVIPDIENASDLQFGKKEGMIYVATRAGLIRIIYDSNQFRFFKQDQRFFPEEMINEISIDEFNNYWLGTVNNGLIRTSFLDTIPGPTEAVKEKYSMNNNPLWISSVFCDAQGHTWVGTLHLGFIKFSTRNIPFQQVDANYPGPYGMNTNNVLWVAAHDSTHLFIKANLDKISYFDMESGAFEYFKALDDPFINAQTTAMYSDSNGTVWAGTRNNGVYRLKKNGDRFRKLQVDDVKGFDENLFRAIDEDHRHRLWLACKDDVYCLQQDSNGVSIVFSLNSHKAFIHRKITNVRALYFDEYKKSIWLGTQNNGLYELRIGEYSELYDTPVRHYYAEPGKEDALQSNFITSFLRTSQNEMWLGTESGGFCKMEEMNDSVRFVSYGESEGLLSNVVKAIEEDSDGNLWISTNVGLTQFNPVTEEFFLFNSEDGYRNSFFETTSAHMGDGILVFGGVYGLCIVNPAKIITSEQPPPFNIARFGLFNKLVKPGDTINNNVLLDKPLDRLDALTLKHDQNVFSIELVSLHYSDPAVYKIRYRLYPVQKDWLITESGNKTVSFSGLSPGKYVLEAQNANKFGEWSQEMRSLAIIIRPPLYRSTAALIIYIILMIVSVFVIIRITRKFLRLEHNLELEQMEKRKIEEINNSKLRFFTNISHELKTPLTLISGPVEALREKLKGKHASLTSQIEMISRQSNNLKLLLDQVIDFQKAESLGINPMFKELNINALIARIAEEFHYLAQNERKKLICHLPEKTLLITADENLLEKIIYNIIINAFKYTDEGDSIEVSVEAIGANIIISVKDTGIGIKEEEQDKIFDRFYRVKNTEKAVQTGSGIGLTFARRLVELHGGTIQVKSTYGKGSEFIVTFPRLQKLVDNNGDFSDEILMDPGLPTSYALEENSLDLNIGRDKVFKDLKVCLVEDHHEIRNYLSGIFSHHFMVKSFENGKACLDSLEEELPDLIVSDVMMPEMNGNELCKYIKETDATSHIPVILLTALSSIENRLEGLEVRADEYVSKPFHLKYLLLKCYNLLERKEKERENFQEQFIRGKKTRPNNSKDAEFVEKLYKIMEENLDNSEFQIDDFSKEFTMNRTQFFKKTKSVTSLTPYELLKNYRLNQAASMLGSTEYTVSEVFFLTGFKSRTHFTKLFTELFGMSPGKYIKQSKKR